ncbi:MAG TPA: LysE family transporter [Chitinivibrionales bacterium]
MWESLITISLVGLGVGIVFSMPIAGPVSILITSHGLRGQLRYCITAALGAAIVDFAVCFIAVHGFTRLFGILVDFVPYILFIGSIILFIIGMRIVRKRFDFAHIDQEQHGLKRFRKVEEKSGFWTGMFLNASNPSLFFGWLTSSAVVMSFVSSVGLNVGGIDHVLGDNVVIVKSFANHHQVTKDLMPPAKVPQIGPAPKQPPTPPIVDGNEKGTKIFQWLFSLSYSFFVALGTIIWFCLLAYFLVRNRAKIKMTLISRVIHGLGICLCAFAVYLMGSAFGFFTS